VGLDASDGQVAREAGFNGPFLSALCDPEQSLAVGCRVLRKKFDAMGGDCTRALLAWNGGGNAEYPVQVMARRAHYV
jgi:soluble lytic murein transglycosylase-like protein